MGTPLGVNEISSEHLWRQTNNSGNILLYPLSVASVVIEYNMLLLYMKKTLIITLLLSIWCSINLLAQNAKTDSIVKIATADAQNFQLKKPDMEKFRMDRRDQQVGVRNPSKMFDRNYMEQVRTQKVDYTSDYFKPTKAMVSDSTLLKDSVYVKAFRDAAYNKTVKRHAGHYIAIFGSIAAGIALIIGFLSLQSK